MKKKAILENEKYQERKKTIEVENKKKEEKYKQRIFEQKLYEELFNKQKEKEFEEKQKKEEIENLNNIKRQEELKIRIHHSLEDLREKIESKEKIKKNK